MSNYKIAQGVSEAGGEIFKGLANRRAIQNQAKEQEIRMRTLGIKEQASNLELEQLRMEVGKMKAENAKQASFQSWDAFRRTGDTKFLNNATKTPGLERLMENVSRFDPIHKADDDMLAAAGITRASIEADPNRYVVVTQKDGKQRIGDMYGTYAMSGYFNYLDKKEIDKIKASSVAATTTQQEQENVLRQKYMEKHPEATIADYENIGKSKDIQNLEYFRENYPELEGALAEKLAKGADSAKMKEIKEAGDTRKEIMDQYPDIYNQTIEPGTKEYREILPKVTKIEKLLGLKVDLNQVSALRKAMTLAEKASDLSEDETGMFDRFMGNIRKYIPDMAKGSESRNAYSQYISELRHALYGATLTEGETENFNAAFGTLYQQNPEIKTALMTALKGQRELLRTYTDIGDPLVSHVRFGKDISKMNTIIDNLSKLEEVVSGGVSKPGKVIKPKPQIFKNPKTGERLIYDSDKGGYIPYED